MKPKIKGWLFFFICGLSGFVIGCVPSEEQVIHDAEMKQINEQWHKDSIHIMNVQRLIDVGYTEEQAESKIDSIEKRL